MQREKLRHSKRVGTRLDVAGQLYGGAIRSHGALGVSIFVLGIEWATQRHYLESVRDDQSLHPQFKSLLRHHWLEESQHANSMRSSSKNWPSGPRLMR